MSSASRARPLAGARSVERKASGLPSASLFDAAFQQRLERLVLVARRRMTGALSARRRSRRRGGGLEFADHRAYLPGDDLRAIDWQVYQRLGRLLVRLYEEEDDLSVALLLDCSGSMAFGGSAKFDQARRVCAALAYIGLAQLDRVSLVGLSETQVQRLPPRRGKGRLPEVLRFLEGLEPAGRTALSDGVRRFIAQGPRPGLALVVSDFYDPEGGTSALDALRFARWEPLALQLAQPLEQELGPHLLGDVALEDCETGESLQLTVTPSLLKQVQQVARQSREQLARDCLARSVSHILVPTERPFDEVLLELMGPGRLLL